MTLPRLILLVASACALAVPASASAAFPGADGPILFDHDGGILSAPQHTISHGGYDWGATGSPDGSKIAYVVNRDIYVMNADGTAKRQLTTDGAYNSDPSFSPDGKKVVFAGGADGGSELYAVPTAGGTPTRLTFTPDHDEHNPAYSPDGTRIAYDRTGCEQSHGGGSCVYVMPAAGGAGVNLTPEDALAECPNQPGYYFDGATREPSWSPDGSKIAFSGPLICTISSIGSDVWVMNADGSGKVDLTRDDATNDRDPQFSPTGSSIAFLSDRDNTQRIYRMGAAGGGITAVSDASGFRDANPDWMPAPAACNVTPLKGETKPQAAAALATMGCKLGKVARKAAKGKAGRVVAQAKPAGKRLPLGAKVAVTLRR